MASRLGMAIRNDKANTRIDAAVARLTLGANVPPAPEPTRDAVLRDTLQLEWIADVLEAIATAPDPEPEPEPTPAPKATARNSRAKGGDA